MTIKQIYTLEQSNTQQIALYREGTFWKAYETSAYLFATHLKPYRPSARYVKTVGARVVSIGFPHSALAGILQQLPAAVPPTDKTVQLCAPAPADAAVFARWKETAPEPRSVGSTLAAQVMAFNLEGSTPMQCLHFVARLKEIVRSAAAPSDSSNTIHTS